MANKITASSVITSISFDVKMYDSKRWTKNVVLKYKPTKRWYLTMGDIHQEDNDSWQMFDTIDGRVFDFQIFGNDDELTLNNYGDYDEKLALRPGLSVSMLRMEYDDKEECWCRTDEWYERFDGSMKIKNLVAHTTDGDKRLRLIKA